VKDDRAAAGEADVVRGIFDEAVALHARVRDMDAGPIVAAARAICAAFGAGGKLLIFGNGGSASDAQHLATELVVRFDRDRAALPALALSTDSSVLTAAANDLGFERVFARQIDALGREGDVALGISTSGGSSNVLRAIETANALGLRTIALTGRDGGAVGAAAAIHINVPGAVTARVQEVHGTVIHVLCALVERYLQIGPSGE
jgi:D-sedoheptulose 7-phosphate isomerase